MSEQADRAGWTLDIAQEIVTDWLGMFDPPPQIDFQQSEFLQQAIASALGIARTGKSSRAAPPSGNAGERATVTDVQWERALSCAHEIMQRDVARHSMQEKGALPTKKILDNAMQHAFGMLSLQKVAAPPQPAHLGVSRERLSEIVRTEPDIECSVGPPQPEPDALRDIVDAEIARWENDDRTMYPDSDVLDSLDRIKAAFPPPVSSCEGSDAVVGRTEGGK